MLDMLTVYRGLQYNSVANIVSMVKSLGMNVIRLTYAIELVDDIESANDNSTLQNTLTNALGTENGTVVLEAILNNNPGFTANTTRLQVLHFSPHHVLAAPKV